MGPTNKEQLIHFSLSIEEHFAYEETFMPRHNYPDFIKHRQGHQTLLLSKTKVIIDDFCTDTSGHDSDRFQRVSKKLFVGIDDDNKYINFLQSLIDGLMHR
jgi:hemerythrin